MNAIPAIGIIVFALGAAELAWALRANPPRIFKTTAILFMGFGATLASPRLFADESNQDRFVFVVAAITVLALAYQYKRYRDERPVRPSPR